MSEVPQMPQFLMDYRGATAFIVLALGESSGLLTALLAGAGSAAELAERAGVDRRNARAWADAMVVGGYATHSDGEYAPIAEQVALISGESPFDMRGILRLVPRTWAFLPRIDEAIREGGGIPAPEFEAAYGDAMVGFSEPMYRAYLVNDITEGMADLRSRLERGCKVVDVAAGDAGAMRVLAEEFPASRFVAYERDAQAVAIGAAKAAAQGLMNVDCVAAAGLPAGVTADVICIFDALHHLNNPDEFLAAAKEALLPDGCLLILETSLSGDPTADGAFSPMAMITYAMDLTYCIQDGLVDGGPGLGGLFSERSLACVLADNGLRIAASSASPSGNQLTLAIPI